MDQGIEFRPGILGDCIDEEGYRLLHALLSIVMEAIDNVFCAYYNIHNYKNINLLWRIIYLM